MKGFVWDFFLVVLVFWVLFMWFVFFGIELEFLG